MLESIEEDACNECHPLATTSTVNPASSLLHSNPTRGVSSKRRLNSVDNLSVTVPKIPRTLESLQNEAVLLISLFRFVDNGRNVHIKWDDKNEPECRHISADVLDLYRVPTKVIAEAIDTFRLHGGIEVPFTWATGSRSSSKIPKGLRSQVLIKHRDAHGNCLPYSLLNVIEADIIPDKEKTFIDAFGSTHGSMKKLAQVANQTLRIILCKSNDLSEQSSDWLLSRDEGLYVIVSGSHAISVDAKRKLIFDCAYPYALKLSLKSLTFCRCFTIDIIRRIQLPHYLLIKQAA